MRRTHYLRERGKLESRAKELRSELERIDRRIAALDVVWNEIFNESIELVDAPAIDLGLDEASTSPLSAASNGAIGKVVENIVGGFSGDFGVKEVESAIITSQPDLVVDRTTIAGKLKKMSEEGRLELVIQGRGRRASSFRKVIAKTVLVPTAIGGH
jgi:hypothetical protein